MADGNNTAAGSLRRHIVSGLFVVIALVAGLAVGQPLLQSLAQSFAQGSIVVETSIKKIQHKEGGIVGEIMVKPGQRVEAGDLLLRLDDTLTRANLAILSKQLDELRSRKARLEAERDRTATITFSDELLKRATVEPDIADALKGERICLPPGATPSSLKRVNSPSE